MVSVLFDGDVEVHYGFLALKPATAAADPAAGRAGQLNGLCGAAEPGCLSMVTGLHTGGVPVRIEAHDEEPPVGAEWEEVVEVSCTEHVAALEEQGGAPAAAAERAAPRDGAAGR